MDTLRITYLVPTDAAQVYDLWVDDALDGLFPFPEGSRVEVVEGEVVVSPAPSPAHNGIVMDVSREFHRAEILRPGFPWDVDINSGLTMTGSLKGFVPDLAVLDRDTLRRVRDGRVKKIVAEEVELVVEVTSPRNADTDRRPGARLPGNKWSCYAAVGIPYYLLVDRDPQAARSVLYSIPDEGTAAYLHEEEWPFGETVHLPDPFALDIDTTAWLPW
ncbi:Uma2 family endonuclease [Actinomadura parmotrematis]|uniref:Uma2 family endonuclease n=1 Tax=Actinomadura parmotrematis TaxID=2864039 RepID=A0ABS7G0L4_9ACTN|nr:Uma2 family endonuclease [Actinomadura parmotrematis]MBW8486254.1 Uma2 family endonuclease [Actinomadura parmotrematis]